MTLCKTQSDVLNLTLSAFIGLSKQLLSDYDTFYEETISDADKRASLEQLIKTPANTAFRTLPPTPIVASEWRDQHPEAFTILRTIDKFADSQVEGTQQYLKIVTAARDAGQQSSKQFADLTVSEAIDLGIKPYSEANFSGALSVSQLLIKLCDAEYELTAENLFKLEIQAATDAEFETIKDTFAPKHLPEELREQIIESDPNAKAYLDAVAKSKQRKFESIVNDIFAEKAIFQEQCFLLSQVPSLLRLKAKLPKNLPYQNGGKNTPIQVFDEPFGFMNRMTQAKHSKNLFNLTTSQISSLVPTIRLYKVITSQKSGEDLGFVEIKFDTNPAVKSYIDAGKTTSAIDLFSSKKKRGVGVGLRDFSFTFHGSDPFAAKKAIQGKISIFATSFGDLISLRKGNPVAINEGALDQIPAAEYKFADLALRTGKTPEDLRRNLSAIQKENLDKLNFRLKVVLGWAIPDKYLSSFSSDDQDAVNDSFINLNLTPTTHEFNFDEMGGVVFNINYLAYIEDYFNNSMFNIFAAKNIEANRIGRKLLYDYLTNNKCDSGDIEKIKKIDSEQIKRERTQSLRRLLSDLSLQKKIYYYNLSYEDISKFMSNGILPDGAKPAVGDRSTIDTQKIAKEFDRLRGFSDRAEFNKVKNELRVSLFSTSRDKNQISFFFISDLLDVIMNNIETALEDLINQNRKNGNLIFNYARQISELDSQTKSSIKEYLVSKDSNSAVVKEIEKLRKAHKQFKKLRVVLGPIEIKDPLRDNKTHPCTIGDIPISLNYFVDFLTEKILSKDLSVYPISNFIKDLTNDIIRNFLNSDSCFSFNTKQRIKFNSSVVSCYNRGENENFGDDITYFIKSNPTTIGKGGTLQMLYFRQNAIEKTIFPILQVSGPSRSPVSLLQPNREINYQIFYAGRSYPIEMMTGNEEQDSLNGIFHYVLGKDRGLVKNISLDRTDMQGLKELRFEQEGFDGLTQLREVYNANIDSMLNLHTFPGTYIYIDPRGFSPETDINYTQFGIGGYYMITRSEHQIGPGKADTKITAKWVADTNGTISSQEESQVVSEEEEAPRKCIAKKRQKSFFDRWSETAVELVDTAIDFYTKSEQK